MGSPLGPTLANAFLCHYEKQWLDNCPSSFKPIVYERYVDDIFVLFSSKEHLQLFVDYMNQQHRCIKFTSETEQKNSFSFLDINITRVNNQFKTSIYRKPTFSGVFTHYESYIDQTYKKSLIFTLQFFDFILLFLETKCQEFGKAMKKIAGCMIVEKKEQECGFSDPLSRPCIL